MTIYRHDEQHAPYGAQHPRADPVGRQSPDGSGLTIHPRPRRYIDDLLDDIRAQIEPEPAVVELALARRDAVLTAAMTLTGVRARFASGSLAHGTAICPIHKRDHGLDADCGVHLDTSTVWTGLGPDSASNEGPDAVLEVFQDRIRNWLQSHGNPKATVKITKRALLVEFHDPLPSAEDPTVDLILGLPRRHGPGLWIPNTEQHRWDASDPQGHTLLFNGVHGPTPLTVTWARTTRLAKAENKCTDPPALCSFNVEALTWMYLPRDWGRLPQAMMLPEALLAVWVGGAHDLSRRQTPDPAGVAKPIKVRDRAGAAERWRQNARRIQAALDPAATDADVRAQLRPLWPDYVPDGPGGLTQARTADAMARRQPLYPAAAGGLTTSPAARPAIKSTRAFGQPLS